MTRRRLIWLGAALLLLGGTLALERASRFDPGRLGPSGSLLVQDRRGRDLRFLPDPTGVRQVWVEEAPELVKAAFLAAEDERFFYHGGVDPAAILRAAGENLRAGRIVSGASTITQQLCRMTHPRGRNLLAKLVEALRAVRLELALSKDRILLEYLNRVPLGNNVVGVASGAKLYFGRSLDRLSPAQAALLASLPKSPGTLNPYGPRQERLLARRNWVLDRLARQGKLSLEALARAKVEPLGLSPRAFPFEAPHVVDFLLTQGEVKARSGILRTTLDLDLQRRVEAVLRSHRPRLAHRGVTQAAAVVLANREMEVRALAGSLEYGPQDQGFNNGALALRSPGSTLKPFLYAQALESGFTTVSILEDTERRYRSPGGEYLPANFDRRVNGPVSLREALGNSLNLSAVWLLNKVGYEPFYQTLLSLGLINFPKGADYYGLGLVVGNPEVSLLQLAQAYACLANQGRFQPARLVVGQSRPEPVQVFSPQTAYLIAHVLADPGARALAFGRTRAMNPPLAVALKSGTSTFYRDSWVVGFTPAYVVAVWAGNFDGRPTWSQSGATAAAPILEDILQELFRLGPPTAFPRPTGLAEIRVCTHSGQLPGPHCPSTKTEIFLAGTEPDEPCAFHAGDGQHHLLPTVFAGWLHQRFRHNQEGRFRLAGFEPDLEQAFGPGPTLPSGRVNAGGGGLIITQPLDGDRFLRNSQVQTINLKALATSPLARVTWLVDGLEHAVMGPPYETTWTLAPGPHDLAVVGPDGTGQAIRIVVE